MKLFQLDQSQYVLKNVVADKIREMILSMEFKPGDMIRQEALSEQIGVSRMPIREALNVLEAEGLVANIPYKGTVVTGISLDDIKEVCLIRCNLEGLAIRTAVFNLTEPDFAYMEKNLDLIREMGDSVELNRVHYHREFHFTIYEAARLPRLLTMIKNLWTCSERIRRIGSYSSKRRPQAMTEHRGILAACRERNPQKAEALLCKHLQSTYLNTSDYLSKTENNEQPTEMK